MNSEHDIQSDEGGGESSGAEMSELLHGSNETEFVTGETKKSSNATTMLLLGVLVLGGAAFYLFVLKQGPEPAAAATAQDAKIATETISKFLGEGGQNVKAMEAMLKDTEKVVEQFNQYPAVKQVPLEELKTNPFRNITGGKPTNKDELAEKKRQEEERVATLKAVQALQLQSVVHGTHRACMINNALYEEGQQIDGFTVEKIEAGAVVVKKGPYRFKLTMQE